MQIFSEIGKTTILNLIPMHTNYCYADVMFNNKKKGSTFRDDTSYKAGKTLMI